MVEFLENVLEFSLKWDLVYSISHYLKSGCFSVFSKESKLLLVEQKLDLLKRELLKYHESFPILAFEGSLSIEMAL